TLELLMRHYRVFIVPEQGRLAERWQAHKLDIPPHLFHDALAFAAFVITEGASTAAEAACLGVHSLYLNSTSRGYLDDMAHRYGLVSRHQNARSALRTLRQWIESPPSREAGKQAAKALVADHIDVTDFVVAEVDSLFRELLAA